MQSKFLVGVVGGVTAVAALAGIATYLCAGKNVQKTPIDNVGPKQYVKVDGHPAVYNTILENRIKGWYHPLPWVGKDIHNVDCPTHLKAVVGAKEMCTAQAGGKRISIPVSVVEVKGDPAKPTVIWKFER